MIQTIENGDKSRGLANIRDVKARLAKIHKDSEGEPNQDDNTLTLTASLSNLAASGNLPQGSQYDNFYADLM